MVALLLVAGFLVAPETADPNIKAAIAAYDALDYDQVIKPLRRALAQSDLADAERVLALAYIGRTQAIYQRKKEAVRAFTKALELDPGFSVSELESPLITEAFAKAQETVESKRAREEVEEQAIEELFAPTGGPPEEPTMVPEPVQTELTLVEQHWPWLAGGAAGFVVLTAILVIARPWENEDAPVGTLGSWTVP